MQLPSNKAALVFLALIVTVSGCADNSNAGVSVSQTEGVAIQSFTATPSEVFENQMVTLELQLKNNGGSEAQNVQAKLYNVPFGGTNRAWKIKSPSEGQKQVSFNKLRAPDPDTDAPSISVPRTWNIEAPNLDQGVTIPYDFYTRIFYNYKTTATTEIQVMSDQRFREQGATRTTPEVDNSGAPIQLDFKTRTPIVLFQDGQHADVCVIVENAGSGTPFSPEASYSNVNQSTVDKVKLNVQTSGTLIEKTETSGDELVSMVGGRGVKCFTLDINNNQIDQKIQQTVPITITAEYGYYQESSTSVTVKGRKDGDPEP